MRDGLGAAQIVLEQLEESITPQEPKSSIYFEYIALPLGEFFAGMQVAQQYLIDSNHCWTNQERFLDIGSGLGTKMAMAHAQGWQPSGIELRQSYANVSRQLFSNFEVEVVDAFQWTQYGNFDLVYMYRPCVDLEHQRKLTQHVISYMKPGALLFVAGGPEPIGLKHIDDLVWVI